MENKLMAKYCLVLKWEKYVIHCETVVTII